MTAHSTFEGQRSGEQLLLAQIVRAIATDGIALPRSLVVDYYVSLKSHPFVILTGAQGQGKLALAQCFATAIVGHSHQQYTLIRGGAWVTGTGEGSYFHDLQARFAALRFVEALQEAALPASEGKLFFICLEGLSPAEVEHYFSSLLYVDAEGGKRLRLHGLPPERHPVVPPNVYITATINDNEQAYLLSGAVLDNASPIEFRPRPHSPAPTLSAMAVPPVGFQRIFQQAAVRRVEEAQRKLTGILGAKGLQSLRPSPELSRLLWQAGVVLSTRTLHELVRYVANAFDATGQGLFDGDDPQGNALKALDIQIAQKVLWRLRGGVDLQLAAAVEAYLDALFPYASERFQRLRQR